MSDDDFFGWREPKTRETIAPMQSAGDAMPDIFRQLERAYEARSVGQPIGQPESPIEVRFDGSIRNHLHRRSDSYIAASLSSGYVLDFLMTKRGRKIGIECDGKAFHERDRDLTRDARILQQNKDIAAIYRLPGSVLMSRFIVEAMAVLLYWEPSFFSDHGKEYLRTAACPGLIHVWGMPSDTGGTASISLSDGTDRPHGTAYVTYINTRQAMQWKLPNPWAARK